MGFQLWRALHLCLGGMHTGTKCSCGIQSEHLLLSLEIFSGDTLVPDLIPESTHSVSVKGYLGQGQAVQPHQCLIAHNQKIYLAADPGKLGLVELDTQPISVRGRTGFLLFSLCLQLPGQCRHQCVTYPGKRGQLARVKNLEPSWFLSPALHFNTA